MSNQKGFSLIEVMIAAVILVPTLGLVLNTTQSVNSHLVMDDTIGASVESLQRSVTRVSKLMRPCSLATYRMAADQTDVEEGRANHVGEWIEPVAGVTRNSIYFRSADGRLSMNALNLTPPRTLRFVMDSHEIANGRDDDGDGLVDEGRVEMIYDGMRVPLVSNVEGCSFSLQDRRVTIEMRSGIRRRGASQTQRFTAREVLYLRNN